MTQSLFISKTKSKSWLQFLSHLTHTNAEATGVSFQQRVRPLQRVVRPISLITTLAHHRFHQSPSSPQLFGLALASFEVREVRPSVDPRTG